MTDYPTALRDFIATLCVGQRYDSCVSSPCRYAGRDGCQHPEHPKHQLASRRTPPGGEGGMR